MTKQIPIYGQKIKVPLPEGIKAKTLIQMYGISASAAYKWARQGYGYEDNIVDYALVDDEDYDKVAQYRWNKFKPSNRNHTWYATTGSIVKNGKQLRIYMHTLITGYDVTDYADHNGLNNTRANLRDGSSWRNTVNRSGPPRNSTGYIGVSFDKDGPLYRAQCTKEGKPYCVPGSFDDAESAALARDKLAVELYGEYAVLNFPDATDDDYSNVKVHARRTKRRSKYIYNTRISFGMLAGLSIEQAKQWAEYEPAA